MSPQVTAARQLESWSRTEDERRRRAEMQGNEKAAALHGYAAASYARQAKQIDEMNGGMPCTGP